MSLINIQNLTFSYEGMNKNIFENVSFQIDTDWKLGLVGRNGRGKTTFLKLLLNELEYSGSISSKVKFNYFPFAIENESNYIYEILWDICPDKEEWEIIREFSYLNLDSGIYYNQYNTLSNGEKTKVLLAGLFLNDNNYLLIDEPTNHLDTEGRKVISNYLKRKKSFILISHDRQFLDICTDHILSINRCSIDVQQGNFSCWYENYINQQTFEMAQNEHLKKEINRLNNASKRTSEWADKTESAKYGNGPVDRGFIGHKAAKMMKRAKATENRQMKAIEEKTNLLKNTEKTDKLKIECLEYRLNKLIQISEVQIKYDNKIICKPITFSVTANERILLDGKNGSGKSSLLKLLIGENIEHTGIVNIPKDLKISYIPQTFDNLQGNISNFATENKIEEPLLRSILNKLGFDKNDFSTNIKDMSQGQKKKILIAKSLSEKAHLYIWDEPLNYLDIFSRIQLEELLDTYKPTMIFVEHDISFQNKIANTTYHTYKI